MNILETSSLLFDIVFGGITGFKVCFGKLIFEARYCHGMANIVTDMTGFSEKIGENGIISDQTLSSRFRGNNKVKNKSLIIMIGLGF